MTELVVNVGYALVGLDLELRTNVSIFIENGIVVSIERSPKRSNNRTLTLPNGLAMPLLVNAHAHTSDYIVTEIGSDLYIDDLVGEPYGLKYRILDRHASRLSTARFKYLRKCLKYGIGLVIDYREQSTLTHGNEFRESDITPRYVALGIPKHITSYREIEKLLNEVQGIAISSPLYYSPKELKLLRDVVTTHRVPVSAHISETPECHEERDLEYLLQYVVPNQIVHGIHLTENEFEILREKGIYLVICPRSNLWLVGKLPSLRQIYRTGVSTALGTDNASFVDPNIWRDLELLAMYMRKELGFVDTDWLLKAATINGYKSIGLEPPVISEGTYAYFMILDADELTIPSAYDKKLALIKRGSPSSVIAVIRGDNVIRFR